MEQELGMRSPGTAEGLPQHGQIADPSNCRCSLYEQIDIKIFQIKFSSLFSELQHT